MKENIQFGELSKTIIGRAIEAHRELGPGLLESAYEQCLAHELRLQGIPFELQKAMPVDYKGVSIDCSYRLDLLVDGKIIVELKAVAAIEPIDEAQIFTYLTLAKVKTAPLIDFNVPLLRDGIRRFVV